MREPDRFVKDMSRELWRKKATEDELAQKLEEDAVAAAEAHAQRMKNKAPKRCLWQDKLNFITAADKKVGIVQGQLDVIVNEAAVLEVDLLKMTDAEGIPSELKVERTESIASLKVLID